MIFHQKVPPGRTVSDMDDFEKKTDATILGIVYHPELRNISTEAKENIGEMVRTLAGSLKKPGSSTMAKEQKHELEEIIDEQVIADEESQLQQALSAASKKIAAYKKLDTKGFKIKLGQFLARRGFNWTTIKKVVDTFVDKR